MKPSRLLLGGLLLAQLCGLLMISTVVPSSEAAPQENTFDIPVQLIGFPIIILAVRISNFIRKLAYSLSPGTYVGRGRRSATATAGPGVVWDSDMDVSEVEKKLVEEMGEDVCIDQHVCVMYAETALKSTNPQPLDWNQVFSDYESSPVSNRENYLLSVFLGDIIKSPDLCRQLAKRGRACK
uniref:(California timema) hypothetical protein n=1 Tax=Timema californicum TaxID=61474 RepID=A0A7R9PC67_TIMCA|nr:unnamed protein product [Timema californicum]